MRKKVNDLVDFIFNFKLLYVAIFAVLITCVIFTITNIKYILATRYILNREDTQIIIHGDNTAKEFYIQRMFPNATVYMYPEDLEVIIGVVPKADILYDEEESK